MTQNAETADFEIAFLEKMVTVEIDLPQEKGSKGKVAISLREMFAFLFNSHVCSSQYASCDHCSEQFGKHLAERDGYFQAKCATSTTAN